MRFKPLSQQELEEAGLIPEGIYNFQVLDAEDQVSKSGNEMIKLKLGVFVDGVMRVVFDYLLEALAFKLKHFTDVTGIPHKYTDGSILAGDCIGKKGHVHIMIVPAKDGYAAKSGVKDYCQGIAPSTLQPLAQPATASDGFDTDLPF
jgi:hypothetical protein